MRGDPSDASRWPLAFRGPGAERHAELRSDAAAIARERHAPGCRVIAFWRGKPLLAPHGAGWLEPDHPLWQTEGPEVFLGRDAATGNPLFARDISLWEPPAGTARPDSGFFDSTEQIHPLVQAQWHFADLRGAMANLPVADASDLATARSLFAWHGSHGFCSCCGAASQIVRAGWQRDCPTCGALHFPRTDPVVIMRIIRGNRLLVGRSPGWPEGMYSLLAGFMEPGETAEAAVRREVREETGIRVGAVRFLSSQPWPYPSSLMLGCEGIAESDAITLDPTELEAALWLTREDLADVFAGTHPQVRTPRPGAIAGSLMFDWLAGRG